MPVRFEKLKYEDILCHQKAYDCFNTAGRWLFEDWDMVGFEKAVLCDVDPRYLQMAEKISSVPELYGDLNEKMPFLRFREEGQHYGYELFLVPPPYWGSPNACLWWAYAARKFTFEKLPMSERLLYEKYKAIAAEFGLNMRGYDHAYVQRFAVGEFDLGRICEDFIQQGWYTVRHRNRLYQEDKCEAGELYLKNVKERIIWFCKTIRHEEVQINSCFDSKLFEFALEDSVATKRQKEIVSALWGIHTGTPMTAREASEYFGITSSRIRQAEKTALSHLVHNRNLPIVKEENG